jgi:precorrin-4/cobalt-precorrin-4 C11-methyltransferase
MERVVEKLRKEYEEDTPVAVIEKASWPEERKITGTLGTISEKVKEAGIKRQALIVVGDVLRKSYQKSRLYNGDFEHGFRKKKG